MTQKLQNLAKELGQYWKVFDDRYVFSDGLFYSIHPQQVSSLCTSLTHYKLQHETLLFSLYHLSPKKLKDLKFWQTQSKQTLAHVTRQTSWSLLGPRVEVGLAPNIMKGINIFTARCKDFSYNYDRIIQVLRKKIFTLKVFEMMPHGTLKFQIVFWAYLH
jgi:hypothetical protein